MVLLRCLPGEQVWMDCYLSPARGTAPTGNEGPFSIGAVFAQIVHSPGEARNKITFHRRQCASYVTPVSSLPSIKGADSIASATEQTTLMW